MSDRTTNEKISEKTKNIITSIIEQQEEIDKVILNFDETKTNLIQLFAITVSKIELFEDALLNEENIKSTYTIIFPLHKALKNTSEHISYSQLNSLEEILKTFNDYVQKLESQKIINKINPSHQLAKTIKSEEDNIALNEMKKHIANIEKNYIHLKNVNSEVFSIEQNKEIINLAFELIKMLNEKIKFSSMQIINNLYFYGYKSDLRRFNNALENFINQPDSEEYQNDFLKSSKDIISSFHTLEEIEQKLEEKKPYSENLQENIEKLQQEINELKSDEKHIQTERKIQQTDAIFQKALQSQSLVDDTVKKLLKATDKEVGYTLSSKLEEKVAKSKRSMYVKLIIFTLSLLVTIVINTGILYMYFLYPTSNIPIYVTETNPLLSISMIQKFQSIDIWKYLGIKLTMLAPFIFHLLFTLNEYLKAKRLYEEFDYKKIMAQTLINNYKKLKEEFLSEILLETKEEKIAKEEKLLDILKAPIEKIFENPVQGIFGDKNGDKGLGIDQLEKLVSIVDKLKGKKD